jgi:hypothetical protein
MVKHVKHAQPERFRRASVCEAQLNLRKTVDAGNGIYRVFEVSPSVFHVLDAGGRTVDAFKVVDCECDAAGVRTKKASRDKPRLPGAPNLADSFVIELNAPLRTPLTHAAIR